LLRALVVAGPLGFIAIEAGWVVTEVGRQPWIIHGILRTADAVTPVPGLVVPFVTFTVLYIILAVLVIALMKRQFLETAPPAGRTMPAPAGASELFASSASEPLASGANVSPTSEDATSRESPDDAGGSRTLDG
jgi:cytochrome d ubiquinol oxidase subunit I